MTKFSNAKEAKEFLVSRINTEAQLEGIPLTDIERKELYLSETAWTIPDMLQVNEEFERDFDQDEYEAKIVGLIKRACKRDRRDDPEHGKLWSEATRTLSREDHYILVMTRRAGVSSRPRGDMAKLLGTAFALIAVLFCVIGVADHFNIDVSHGAVKFYEWAIAVAVVLAYYLALMVLGRKRTNDLLGRIVEESIARFVRTKQRK